MKQRLPRTALLPVLTLACAAPLLCAQGADPSRDALRMGSPAALPNGATVESMWPAPSAEDWERPCLVRWQRTFEDAWRVSEETGKPILVCVNMDGEPASEHWSGIRYRQEETARLFEPYVCVIASVYRHTLRDHDEEGRRIPCPRFGTVTCGEHIAIEPILYERYFEGRRIAPRHIMLERDGSESYDVYYSWDTDSVVTALRSGAKEQPPAPEPVERPLAERIASADSAEREELERVYLGGTREERRALLETTLRAREVDQVELLRLALFGLDLELARLARQALARSDSEAAVDLIAEALKVPMAEEERALLVAAAERLAEKYPRARTLVAVQRGLSAPSRWIDAAGWSGDAAAQYRSAVRASDELEANARTAESRPEDGASSLALAESLVARAQQGTEEPSFAQLLLEDAHAAALRAEAAGASGWRLDAVLAVTHAARGERDQARARALSAFEGGMPRTGTDAPLGEPGALRVLELFAQARQRAIARAYRERAPWPPEWLADVHAAYAVLVRHPLGTDQHAADGFDFLHWLGASARAQETLERGLTRFPDSWLLHERLRTTVLEERGPAGLEQEYAVRLARSDASPSLSWFAAYASLVAAENHRRSGAREEALAAYGRALERYAHDLERHPDHDASNAHYSALALAGRAQVHFELGQLETATRELLSAFARAPTAAASFDGLGMTPIDSARMLLARLEGQQETELAASLQACLQALGPELLDQPDLQRGVPNEAARVGDRRPRRPQGQGG